MDLFTEHYAHSQRALLDDDARRAARLGPHLAARRRWRDRVALTSRFARRPVTPDSPAQIGAHLRQFPPENLARQHRTAR